MSVAVVIPTKNRAGYLAEALASVRLAGDIVSDVVVVDDGSTDGTLEVCRAAGVRVVQNRGHGAAAGRNTGICETAAEFIAFLDDDDVWLDGHVRLHLEAFARHPNAGVVFTRGFLTNQELGERNGPYPGLPLPSGDAFRWALANTVQPSTMVVRRSALEASGLFDESLPSAEDCDVCLRLAQRVDFVGLETPTVLWRQHPRRSPSFEAWEHRNGLVWPMFAKRFDEPARVDVSAIDRKRAIFKRKGWHAASALVSAEQCLEENRTGDARRFWFGAFRSSPLHCLLRLSAFYRVGSRAFVR